MHAYEAAGQLAPLFVFIAVRWAGVSIMSRRQQEASTGERGVTGIRDGVPVVMSSKRNLLLQSEEQMVTTGITLTIRQTGRIACVMPGQFQGRGAVTKA